MCQILFRVLGTQRSTVQVSPCVHADYVFDTVGMGQTKKPKLKPKKKPKKPQSNKYDLVSYSEKQRKDNQAVEGGFIGRGLREGFVEQIGHCNKILILEAGIPPFYCPLDSQAPRCLHGREVEIPSPWLCPACWIVGPPWLFLSFCVCSLKASVLLIFTL